MCREYMELNTLIYVLTLRCENDLLNSIIAQWLKIMHKLTVLYASSSQI